MMNEKESQVTVCQPISSKRYLSSFMSILVKQLMQMDKENRTNDWWLGSLRAKLLAMVYLIECDKDFVLNHDGLHPQDHYYMKKVCETASDQKENILSKDEFVDVMNNLSRRLQMAEEIDEISHKYHNDFLDGYVFLDTKAESAIVKILETMFQDDEEIIEWWMVETEYGRKYNANGIMEDDLEVDLSTAEALYDYLIDKMKK